MSYIDRKQDPRRRANAIVAVATVHAVLAIGLLKGLDIDFERIIPTPFEGTQIPLDPPKPDPPPPSERRARA